MMLVVLLFRLVGSVGVRRSFRVVEYGARDSRDDAVEEISVFEIMRIVRRIRKVVLGMRIRVHGLPYRVGKSLDG